MEWLKNLNAAIDYIEENLNGELCYEDVAAVACCSPYYFQRIFSWVVGISLAEYIRRRRMSQAAMDLQLRREKVSDIALKYGYTSPTSFNRAFQSVHGMTPAVAKKREVLLKIYPPARFSVEVTGNKGLRYRIVEKKAIRIAGVRIRLTEDMGRNRECIPDFWKDILRSEMLNKIGRLRRKDCWDILGVSVYEDRDNIFYYIGVVTDKVIPVDMCEYKIPSSVWVVFEQDGDFREEVQGVFRRFYKEWLLLSAYEYAGLPDIEVYPFPAGEPKAGDYQQPRPGEKYSQAQGTGNSQVWISIKEDR